LSVNPLRKTHLRAQTKPMSAAVALDTGKIIKKLPGFFDRKEDSLQNFYYS